MEASLWCWLLVTAILSASHASSQQPAGIRNCLPPHIRKETEINIDYFIDGMRIDIPCIAKGDGKLIYTWTKSGQQLDLNNPEVKDRITMGPETGTLHITAREMDEGEYQCSVSNECGKSLSRKMLLLLAKSLPFPLLEKPADVRKVLGTYLKLECKPPETIPKPRLSWIIKANNTGDSEHTSTVQLNSRVTMDYEGNLHITSVRKEDEQEGKTYVCQAENLFTRSVNIGEDKRITVQGTKMSDQGVDLKWHSGNETLVMVGKRARMKCIFSGQPDPTISWSRLSGGELENSTRVTFDGNELIINQVQYKDAGDYQCTGRNNRSQDSKSHTFKLTVQAVPQWKSLPQHVSVGVEESASFNCDATGEPTPTVQWYINGRPYEDIPPSSRRDLRNNTLTFTTLETEDSQVIQCNASNKHGSIWADVYLYVQAMAPVFEQKPPEKLVVAERQDAIVTCLVLGKPKPRIMWYKGNQLLEQAARFTVMDNGNLHIQNISTKEAGKYRCVAENRFGKDQAEGEVIVRERTFIQTRPINDQVDYTNPHTFTCHASTDSKEMSNLRIHWLKDGELISPSDRIIIDSNQLTIKETTSKDTANYTCLAENGLDKDTATATLEVKAVPDAPLNVSVEECLSKRATIKWIFEDKMRNFDTMTKFIIEYTTEYKPDVWVTATSQTYPALTAKVDLSPYAKYKFRVKAVNAMGISDASQPTYSSCETPMFSPDRNPDNVHTDESSTGFLVVKWKVTMGC